MNAMENMVPKVCSCCKKEAKEVTVECNDCYVNGMKRSGFIFEDVIRDKILLKKNDIGLATYKVPMDEKTRQAYDFAYKILDDLMVELVGETGV